MNAYTVISSPALPNLAEGVNKLIADGYAPQGGIAVEGTMFHQAMYRIPPVAVEPTVVLGERERINQQVCQAILALSEDKEKHADKLARTDRLVTYFLGGSTRSLRDLEDELRTQYLLPTNRFVGIESTVDSVVDHIFINQEED